MDLRRLRTGEWIAAVAGVALLLLMNLNWYSVKVPAGQGVEGVPDPIPASAWDVFSVLDLCMALSAVLAIGLLVLVAMARSASVGISAQSLSVLFAGVVAIMAVIRLVSIPGGYVDDQTPIDVTTSRSVVAYLGTLAAVAIPVGLVVAMRDERLSKPGHPVDATGVPYTPPNIETLPAPRP